MRYQTPLPVPYHRRTPVVSVELDPVRFGNVIVVDTMHNVGSMSILAFEATCRVVPGAVVDGIRVVP